MDGGEPTQAAVLNLDGECTLERAVELRSVLLEALNGAQSLSVDLQKVTAVDLSFLQLMCSMHRAALNTSKEVMLTGELPEAFVRIAEDAGFVRGFACRKEARVCLFREVVRNE